jgi:hypothetical protein
MPTATLYNLPPSMVGYAAALAGIPLTIGTTATGRGVKAIAWVADIHQARLIVSAWRDGQLLASGFTTAQAANERVEMGGQRLAE